MCVFGVVNVMVSQAQSQEETQDRLRKTKFIVPKVPRNRRNGASQGPHREEPVCSEAGGQEWGGKTKHRLYWSFHRKGKLGQGKHFRIS